MKKNEHLITVVYPGSIAEEMEIETGDYLLAINDKEIKDVFDYRYMIKDEYIEVLIRKSYGEEWLLEIEKDYDDDLGVEFENGLMSDYRSCTNKCMFCFIDQMPPGMRETLYFKDDDSRLSFLQGNYITLTNMTDEDVDRIIKMQLAPINISIQTTNPDLRCKMLHNRFAGDRLKYLDRLFEGHVEMNGQIVLCKHVNDGTELERSIRDLGKYLPFMRSVSVVPAGLTKYRQGLYPLELFTKEEAGQVIDLIESYQKEFYEKYSLHFIHASDEWYITANYAPNRTICPTLYSVIWTGTLPVLQRKSYSESFRRWQFRCQSLLFQKQPLRQDFSFRAPMPAHLPCCGRSGMQT